MQAQILGRHLLNILKYMAAGVLLLAVGCGVVLFMSWLLHFGLVGIIADFIIILFVASTIAYASGLEEK